LKVASPSNAASLIEPVNEPLSSEAGSSVCSSSELFTFLDLSAPFSTLSLMLFPLPLVSFRVISLATISTSSSLSSVTFKPPPALPLSL